MMTVQAEPAATPALTRRSWPPPRLVEDPEPPQEASLAEAMAEPGTVLLLVVGAGPDSDQAERRCRDLALDPGFEEVRVVRIRDRAELTGSQRACWLAGDRPLAVLGPDRRLALPLERADAVDLFVAVASLAA